MSSTPESRSLVLRDDLPAPDGYDAALRDGTTLLVAVPGESPDSMPVAAAALSGDPPLARLDHLWVRRDLRRGGLGRFVLEMLRGRASSQGITVLSVRVSANDVAMTALASRTRILGEHLQKPVDPGVAVHALGYRPLTPDELGPWRETQVKAYAQDELVRLDGNLDLALEQARDDFDRLLPAGLKTPDTSLVVLTSGGERVGHLWVAHHVEPGLSFVYDVEVMEHRRGHGFGRAAMVVAEVLARDAGDDRIGLHVFGGNTAARNLYRTQGYVVQSTTYDLLSPTTTGVSAD